MGRDHSIECPLCELSYGGLGSDDTDCPDCGRLALVREAEWLRTKSEVERLRAELAGALSMQKENDMNLLRKLASGEGGRRTGALKRAGFLEWTVTPAGLAALASKAPPPCDCGLDDVLKL